jgi:tRNA dimethylallyltransferase
LDALSKRLIVIVGPTAVGKTAVALMVARHFGAEIISADSRQIFRELNIGTAKPQPSELEAVRHHFVNSHAISDSYDAAQFGEDASSVINSLFRHQNTVVLVGGSGLYVQAALEGFDDIPEVDPVLRTNLAQEYKQHGIGALQEKMRRLDPELFAEIDQHNPHRLIRALEVMMGTGRSISTYRKRAMKHQDYAVVKIGLTLARDELYKRIDNRMDTMIADGLFEEARALLPNKDQNALQTVGYQEIFPFFEGQYSKEEAIRLLKRNSRRYAKRQLTWFKRDPEIVWLNPANIADIISIAGGTTHP